MIWEKSIAVSFLILIVCIVRVVGRGKIRSGLIYSLWGLVALRLLWPMALPLPTSSFSVQNLVPDYGISQQYKEQGALPEDLPTGALENPSGNELWEMEGQRMEQDQPMQQGQSMLSGQENVSQDLSEMLPMQPDASLPIVGETGIQSSAVKLPDFGVIWISGSLVVLVVVGVTQLRFSRRLKKERVVWTVSDLTTDPQKALPIYLWEKAESPFLYGTIHPSVYVTEECMENEKKRHYVLLHEYCHYQHGDHIWTLIRTLCLVLYWYHPLVWVAAYLSRIDCELACDDSVRARLGERQRLDYANALLAVLESGIHSQRICDMTTSMSGGGKEVAQRLTLLWKKRPGRVLTAVMAAVLVVTLSMLAFTESNDGEVLAGETGREENETLQDPVELGTSGSSKEDPIVVIAGQRLLSGVYYQSNIDEDDDPEVFCYHGTEQAFEIDGKRLAIPEGIFEGSKFQTAEVGEEPKESRQVYYLTDIRTGDGQLEFALLGTSKELYAETAWLVVDDTSMIHIGTVEGWPFAEETYWTLTSEMQTKLEEGIWGLDGQGHIGTYRKLSLIEEMWTDVVWELDPVTGLLQCKTPESGFYTCSSSRYSPVVGGGYMGGYEHTFYLQNQLPVYREPDLGAETFVMYAHPYIPREPIALTHTDDKNWVRIQNDYGEVGWIYIAEKPEGEQYENRLYGTLLTPDGMKRLRSYIVDGYKSLYTEDEIALEDRYPVLQTKPQTVTMTGTQLDLVSNVLYQADLDGDGDLEEFVYCGLENEEEGTDGGYPVFVIEGARKEMRMLYYETPVYAQDEQGNVMGQTFYLCDLDPGDGHLELVVTGISPHGEEGEMSVYYRWTQGRIIVAELR